MPVRLLYDDCQGAMGGQSIEEFGRYSIATMAVGIDVNDANARKEVVSRVQTPDFQRVPEPVQFELVVALLVIALLVVALLVIALLVRRSANWRPAAGGR